MNRPYGKVRKGNARPYGSLVGAGYELKRAVYYEGYARDEDMPELPHPPRDNPYDPIPELEERMDAARLCALLSENLAHKRWYQVMFMRIAVEMTLEEVGQAYGVTRERIRQVELRALRESRKLLILTGARLK